ncbi:MAG: hypothetical protein PHY48_13815 [Candidatus Cloacimonetes bacterium]|nr:hypothetical protein [Candidatus Cloacimonadota bacterium]
MAKETQSKQKFLSNPDNIATILGLVGAMAIICSMFFRGFSVNNVLDAVKDIMGLSISVGIYWLANRIYFSKKQVREFHDVFEEKLQDWADKNKYLIEPKCIPGPGSENGTAKDRYRCYKMVADHTNLIRRFHAADADSNTKAVFIKLPFERTEEGYNSFRFYFTDSSKVFLKPEKGNTSVKPIVDAMTNCIRAEYSSRINGISFLPASNEIKVDISSIDRSSKHQEQVVDDLIDLIDFVKILFLAQA